MEDFFPCSLLTNVEESKRASGHGRRSVSTPRARRDQLQYNPKTSVEKTQKVPVKETETIPKGYPYHILAISLLVSIKVPTKGIYKNPSRRDKRRAHSQEAMQMMTEMRKALEGRGVGARL